MLVPVCVREQGLPYSHVDAGHVSGTALRYPPSVPTHLLGFPELTALMGGPRLSVTFHPRGNKGLFSHVAQVRTLLRVGSILLYTLLLGSVLT